MKSYKTWSSLIRVVIQTKMAANWSDHPQAARCLCEFNGAKSEHVKDSKCVYGDLVWVSTRLRFPVVSKRLKMSLLLLSVYLIIICPNLHEQLIKSEIRLSSSRFEHCSESLV